MIYPLAQIEIDVYNELNDAEPGNFHEILRIKPEQQEIKNTRQKDAANLAS